ncbi:hypothetical protein PVAND_017484 [Polypedilum vanderplanki]|uniref:C2H2-type domain-containing protein n=1 Tax=Polypedilum vanderplanki TaxID=319348 RepID=A0A9J6BIF0_POLVA|nr:hypothetical protein PVAND_017484 [Polypedilum vanderplanki]
MLHQQNEKINNFECDFDGKLFKKKLGLYQHMKQRHQIQACKICGNKVKGMNYHLLRCHSDDTKTFPCRECNKKFSANCLLNHHEKSHEKQFNCNFCGRNFAHLSTLKEHEEFHKNPKAYQCQICGNCSKRKGD